MNLLETFKKLNQLNEDTPENDITRSKAVKEGGLKCPYCGSTSTKYVDTDQEADPEKDGAGGTGTQYVERHNYECNNCTCKFYTYTETIVLRGTEIYQDGIDDNEETSIKLDEGADIYGGAQVFDVNEGLPWEEHKKSWYDDASDEEIKDESYEFNGLWYEGRMPAGMSYFESDEQNFIDLSNKIHELYIDVDWEYDRYSSGNAYGYLNGTKENLREFISWCADKAFQPFYDGEEYWHWENENDKEDWEFSRVYR